MLNPFPTLLNFSFFAPTILRLFIGIYFINLGYIKYTKKEPTRDHTIDLLYFFNSLSIGPSIYYVKTLAIIELLVGVFLCLGFFVQISAIITAIISLVFFIVSIKQQDLRILKPSEYALLFAISLSLILTGAGVFAIDLPL